jgi:hypothetical protein
MAPIDCLQTGRPLSSLYREPVRDTAPLQGSRSINCISCGSNLSFLSYSYPFTFQCARGHFQTLQGLLDVFLSQGEEQTRDSILVCWERKALLLRHLAQLALEVGHIVTAADFQVGADRIQLWLAELRRPQGRPESEAILSS